MNIRLALAAAILGVCSSTVPAPADEARKIPVLYSTDLHHPHVDPDDHFDLATLFSIPEFDVRGVVLDCGGRQQEAPGEIPLSQLMHLAGCKVPYAVGLARPLARPDDPGLDQPEFSQGGVRLILDALDASAEPVTVFTTGSLRDVAAALNRRPELLRRKIARLYVNIGNPATGKTNARNEYNVDLDRQAYLAIMQSGLPVYWCPCFDGGLWQRGRYGTFWKFRQSDVLESAPTPLQNWFVYALTKPKDADPIAFLSAPQDPAARANVWKMSRNMWCTAPFLHAAGRRVYRRGEHDYVALQPDAARTMNLADREVPAFDFAPAAISAHAGDQGAIIVDLAPAPAEPNVHVFRSLAPDYPAILTSCLKSLFAEFPRHGQSGRQP